jgi:hypothetical protein
MGSSISYLRGGWEVPYHLCGFGAGYGKLQIGILLPVTKKEGKLCEEAIVVGANGGDSLGIRVTIDAALEGLGATDNLLPSLKVVGIIQLSESTKVSDRDSSRTRMLRSKPVARRRASVRHTNSSSSFLSSAFSSSEPP